MRALLSIIGIMIVSLTLAQEVQVSGKFLTDSIRIGEPVPYALSATYPSHRFVLFPDSLDEFKPFEYHRKRYFPTETKNGISRDSAIYWVTSFEIDSIQFLSLAVMQLSDGDSIYFQSASDSIFLSSQVHSLPDTLAANQLPLKIDTVYRVVNQVFNYPAFMIGAGILLMALTAVWIIFGKRIRKWWLRHKLTRSYQSFERAFQTITDKIKNEGNRAEAEHAVRIWKGYLEELERIPYTSYTTKEILSLQNHTDIRDALMSIDQKIYGGRPVSDVSDYFSLKNFSQDRYFKKLEELK
jgi:hypothetical protein